VTLVSDREPYADIAGAPVPLDDDDMEPRTRFVDWRLLVVLVVLVYVLILAWTNSGTTVTIQLPPCLETEIGLVWLVLTTLLVGSAITFIVQAGYRGYRKQHQALEEAARADLTTEAKPGRKTEGR
jgi:uncharacterized integral membrane protein